MPPVILLQRAELWELRAGLRANRPWRVWRFRHGQVRWCVERHAKTPRYDSLHVGREGGAGDEGHAVSHAEGDLKDKETMKCEHGRDVFEVTPTSPAHTTTATATTSAQPLPDPYQPPFPSPPPSFPLSHLAGSYTLSWPGGCGEFSSGSC